MMYNGRYGGGGKVINPLGIVNDGKTELIFYNGVVSKKTSFGLFDGLEKGGLQVYDPQLFVYRISKVKLTNKGTNPDGSLKRQDINIDGEDLMFTKQVKMEVLPSKI